MMKYTAEEFNRAKSRWQAISMPPSPTGKSAQGRSGRTRAKSPRRRVNSEEKGERRETLAAASAEAIRKARPLPQPTITCTASPWTAIGVAAAAGVLIGFLAARR